MKYKNYGICPNCPPNGPDSRNIATTPLKPSSFKLIYFIMAGSNTLEAVHMLGNFNEFAFKSLN